MTMLKVENGATTALTVPDNAPLGQETVLKCIGGTIIVVPCAFCGNMH